MLKNSMIGKIFGTMAFVGHPTDIVGPTKSKNTL
jgi:hypothetical protein